MPDYTAHEREEEDFKGKSGRLRGPNTRVLRVRDRKPMNPLREHQRRLRIKLAALRRHQQARDPVTGKSELAVAAGKASGLKREGDQAWGLELALQRWHPQPSEKGERL